MELDKAAREEERERDFGRVTGVALFVAALAAVVAGATIWLVLTEPVTVASAFDAGEISPLVLRLAEVIYQALAGLLDYL